MYCNLDRIYTRLPEGVPQYFKKKYLELYPASTDSEIILAWKTELETIIESNSAEIDARLKDVIAHEGDQVFDDYPDTPKPVVEIARCLSLSEAYSFYGQRGGSLSSDGEKWLERAEKKITDIIKGKIVVSGKVSVAVSRSLSAGSIRTFDPIVTQDALNDF